MMRDANILKPMAAMQCNCSCCSYLVVAVELVKKSSTRTGGRLVFPGQHHQCECTILVLTQQTQRTDVQTFSESSRPSRKSTPVASTERQVRRTFQPLGSSPMQRIMWITISFTLAVIVIWFHPGAQCIVKVAPTSTPERGGPGLHSLVRRDTVAKLHPSAASKATDLRPGESITHRASRATRTEYAALGNIQLVDVGDSVPSLADFVKSQAELSEREHAPCVLAATLPDCPSCAALGYALLGAPSARHSKKLRLIRVNVEEFEEDLNKLGLQIQHVPLFALVDATGRVRTTLDTVDDLPYETTVEFLSVLSNFIQGRLGHSVGSPIQTQSHTSVDL